MALCQRGFFELDVGVRLCYDPSNSRALFSSRMTRRSWTVAAVI